MRILFATTAGGGHFGPLVPVAHACRRLGHEVLVAGPPDVAPFVARAGLLLRPVAAVTPTARAEIVAGLDGLAPRARLERAIGELFVRGHARAALPGMLSAIAAWRPDVVVRESGEFASHLAAERLGVPQVTVALGLTTELEAWGATVAAPALDELRAELGLPADPGSARLRSTLALTQAPRALDGAGAPDPPFLLRVRTGGDPAPPPAQANLPLVYVSFGTEVPSRTRGFFPGLYREVLDALAPLPVRVLATVGTERDPAELGPPPRRARVEQWVDQAAVMPHAAAMVTHGGAGSTLAALAGGVPMAIVPLFADQPFNAARVAELGAGLALDGPAGVGAAVRELLEHDRYSAAAGRLAAEIRALPLVDAAVPALLAAAGEHHATAA